MKNANLFDWRSSWWGGVRGPLSISYCYQDLGVANSILDPKFLSSRNSTNNSLILVTENIKLQECEWRDRLAAKTKLQSLRVKYQWCVSLIFISSCISFLLGFFLKFYHHNIFASAALRFPLPPYFCTIWMKFNSQERVNEREGE